MGDATHVNVPSLARAGTDMVAGYVTGSPDVVWTAADWALFAGKPQITIDQAFTGSPVASAIVRDVQAGAWSASAAADLSRWTALRPTIYCSLSALSTVAAAGWRGDVWVADYTSSPPSRPPAVPAGMTCVAVQYSDQGGGGTYDLSVVFDPYWPATAAVATSEEGNVQAGQYSDGRMIVALTATDGNVYVTEQASVGSGWSGIGSRVGGPVPVGGALSLEMELVADVPTVFIQSADPVASRNGDVYTSWKLPDGTWASWTKIS